MMQLKKNILNRKFRSQQALNIIPIELPKEFSNVISLKTLLFDSVT